MNENVVEDNVVFQITKTVEFGKKLYINVEETKNCYDVVVKLGDKSKVISTFIKDEETNTAYIEAVDEATELGGFQPIKDMDSFLDKFYFGK